MKIAIFGAGAMGCLFAAFLCEKNQVTLFDIDKAQIDAINKNGITVIANGTEKQYKTVKAVCNGTDIGAVDLVIVFVKGMHTFAVMDANKQIIGPDTLILTLQNGAGNDRDMLHYTDEDHVLVGTTKHNCVNLGEGKISHTGDGVTNIGGVNGSMENVCKLGKVFRDSRIDTVEYEDIQRVIWTKLFVNLSINSVTALLNVPIGYVGTDPHAWATACLLIDEALAVASADGTQFDREEILAMVKETTVILKDGYASMCQDRRNKVKTEIDRINGAIVRQAELYGIPTPYNSMMVELIHAMEDAY